MSKLEAIIKRREAEKRSTRFYGYDAEELFSLLLHLSHSITAPGAPGEDAAGGTVSSLTEAVMGVTAGLCKIADALNRIADNMRE